MSCSQCNVELTLTNSSKKQYKRVTLHNKKGICTGCQKIKDSLRPKPVPKVKKIKGKPRFKFITSKNIEIADNLINSQKMVNKVVKTIKNGSSDVLFLDLHNTFDMFISYAKKGQTELNEVLDLFQGKSIIIITFVGWNNKTTEIAINDIQWSIDNLNVCCGIVVSERNKRGTTPESQIFKGGKGWIINLITNNQKYPKKTPFYFSDDFEDHIVSVQTTNKNLAGNHLATTLESLRQWIQKLSK